MRVAYLAAGAGGMMCGSCLRDNRLVATLRRQGRDAVLIPLYTPLRTDEEAVSSTRVYYGGLSVFLQQYVPALRHLPRAADRLLDAPALLRWAGRWSGGTRPETLGPLTVSVLRGEDGRQRRELNKLVDGLRRVSADIVNLPNLMFIGTAARIRSELGVPVACTLGGEDVFLDQLPPRYRDEALREIHRRRGDVDAYLAVTDYYAARAVERFGLPHDRVHVIPMGIHVDGFEPAPRPPQAPFTIGFLARICPEKGLDRLCDALTALRAEGRACRLRIAGYPGAGQRRFLNDLRRRWVWAGDAEHVDVVGEVDRVEKVRFLQSSHVLSVPASYPEAKGLYALEAMACGVPVVLPASGSFPEIVHATGGGLLYNPDEGGGLERALASLMDDEARRRGLGAAGREGVLRLYTDVIMADRTWERYVEVARSGAKDAVSAAAR